MNCLTDVTESGRDRESYWEQNCEYYTWGREFSALEENAGIWERKGWW